MARGPGRVGDPRAHHGRRDRLAVGAAAAGVRAPCGPADASAGRAVLRAGQAGTRAGWHGPGHRLGCRRCLPAAGPARDHGHRRGHRPGHAHPAHRARGRGRAGPADSARRLAGRRRAGGPGRRGHLSPRGVQRPRNLGFPGNPDEPRPHTGSSRADRGTPADLAQSALAAVPRTATAGRAHRGRPAGDPGRSRRTRRAH